VPIKALGLVLGIGLVLPPPQLLNIFIILIVGKWYVFNVFALLLNVFNIVVVANWFSRRASIRVGLLLGIGLLLRLWRQKTLIEALGLLLGLGLQIGKTR
jgi:hypothetical protein